MHRRISRSLLTAGTCRPGRNARAERAAGRGWKVIRLALALLTLTGLLTMQGRVGRATVLAPLVAAPVQSSANSIACGQTLTGNISVAGQQDTYTFSANADEAVSIAAIATSGTLGARLELYSPAGVLITSTGFGNTSTGSVKLTVTGTYTVIVRDNNLTKTGRYSLSLQFTTGRCAVALACGETKSETEVALVSQQDAYTFSAIAGEAVNIAAVATTGTLGARLELYSPAGVLITSTGFGNTNTGSVKLTAAGVYTVLVRDNNLSKVGRYNLNLQFTTGRCAATIAGGQVLNGSISSVAKQDSFVFFGRQGGSVIISAIATSGALGARLELYSPAGTLITSTGFGNTSTGSVAIQETGVHLILVRDNNLTKAGNYNLNLTCLGNGCPPAVTIALAPASQAVAPGSTGNLTVTISPAQTTATVVTLNSTNPAVMTVAPSVTVAANATTASFAVTGVALGTATVIAALPSTLGGSANAGVTVALPCQPVSALPAGFIPFSQIAYITGANAAGDRLVVGKMPPPQFSAVPLPSQADQRFCTPVQLAAGLFAITYAPTLGERGGDFSAFAGQLIDPLTGAPFPGGLIPANRLSDLHAWRMVSLIGSPATVSAASYSAIALAGESIASAFGARLATGTTVATQIPLPTALAGTSVKVIDGKAVSRDAPLFFVSPDQVNFQIPAGTSAGPATIIITSGDGSVAIGVTQIDTVAPGLFTGNANAQGVAAALVQRVKSNGAQSYEPVMDFDQGQNKFVPRPIDLGPEGEQVFLVLFGTGFRSRSSLGATTCLIGGSAAEVLYAGPQNQFVGLDQCNVRLPRTLAGRGEVEVELTVDGKAANAVRIAIK